MKRFIARNKALLVVTGLLMAGSGCVGAVRETNQQLTEDALKPITVPLEGYQRAKDVTDDIKRAQEQKQREIDQMELP
jgi:hypothetical protein